MAKKYFVTMASHLISEPGISASRGSWLYEMEGEKVDELVKNHPGSLTILTKEEYDAEKKMMFSSGSATGSQLTQPPPAPPAEEDVEVTEAEALKVSKVKEPEKKSNKKGKS
tara:strand:- start:5429 stop:5764 length:336 start_codon:yes stop_codon:yes gene_type:complete